MLHLPIHLTENLILPLTALGILAIFTRHRGKRELAQLNPADLAVLLAGKRNRRKRRAGTCLGNSVDGRRSRG